MCGKYSSLYSILIGLNGGGRDSSGLRRRKRSTATVRLDGWASSPIYVAMGVPMTSAHPPNLHQMFLYRRFVDSRGSRNCCITWGAYAARMGCREYGENVLLLQNLIYAGALDLEGPGLLRSFRIHTKCFRSDESSTTREGFDGE